MNANQQFNIQYTLGCRTEDGTVLETVYNPSTITSKFVFMKNNKIHEDDEYQDTLSKKLYRPCDPLTISAGKFILPTEVGDVLSPSALLEGFTELLRKHLVFSTEEEYPTVGGYLMSTWFNDNFQKIGYLRFYGPYGSGKSQALAVSRHLAYHAGSHATSQSGPTFFRTLLEYPNSTLFLEEAEEYTYSARNEVLYQVLKAGNFRDGTVPRTSSKTEKVIQYPCYGPKIMAGTSFFSDLPLESRIINCFMYPAELGSVPMSLPENWEEATKLRNNCLAYRLANYDKVKPQEIPEELKKYNMRALEICLPILWVLQEKGIPEFLHKTIKKTSEMMLCDSTTRNDVKLAAVVKAFIVQSENKVSGSQIRKKFEKEYHHGISFHEINSLMTQFGVYKKQTKTSGYEYHLDSINRTAIKARYEIDIPEV